MHNVLPGKKTYIGLAGALLFTAAKYLDVPLDQTTADMIVGLFVAFGIYGRKVAFK